MKLAFAGGGTGGHLAPAIALLEELRGRGDDSPALFLTSGRPGETPGRLPSGCRVFPLPAAPLSPGRPWSVPARLLRNRQGYRRAREILRESRPDLVFGLGGYVSVPTVLAARRLKIPAVCHEQNRVLGRANRLLARGPVPVISAFPLAGREGGSAREIQLGSPVREAAREAAPEGTAAAWGLELGRFTVLVLGGSRGARAVNRLLEAAAGLLAGGGIQIIHCAGREDAGRLERVYRERSLPAAVFSGLERIGWAYSLADLAVARAGGATLAELAFRGLPSLLIPYPHATDGHQLANADYFAAAGAAAVFPEAEITPERLAGEISRLRSDREARARMRDAARGLGRGNAAGDILDYLRKLIGSGDE